jgi:low temperature requirement protein LtrA
VSSADRAEEQEAPAGEELRVSTIELFFDLVFVFTLTQLTSLLAEHLTTENLARVVLIFVVLFWMYGGYVWLTNQVPPDRPARRLLMILGMAAIFICALAIPEAFDGSGVAFGIGYLLVILVHAGLWTQVYDARVVLRFGPFNVAAAVSVIIAGLLGGPAAYTLWVAAIVILFVTPRIAGRAAPQFPVRSRHFVERHGLLLIVALGESVVAIGIGIAGVPLTLKLFGAGVLSLALVAAMWWAYFVGDEEGAEHAMTSASPAQRFGLAINGYFFAYIPILLGVITTAAGIELSIGDVLDRLEAGPTWLLAGGVALYLTGDVVFRLVMRIHPIMFRAAAVLVAPGAVALGLYVSAALQLFGLAVIVVAALTGETRARHKVTVRAKAS